jgi:hypothetical protein
MQIGTWIGRAGSSGKLMARLRLGGGLAERNPELDSGAGAGAAFDSAPSPSEFGALPDERQPQMTGAVFDVGRIIARAVIDYPDQAAVVESRSSTVTVLARACWRTFAKASRTVLYISWAVLSGARALTRSSSR